MRNAIEIGEGFIVTTDNSGGIGEKASDIVHVPDQLTAYYAARVTLLEQWAAHAEPKTVLIHNFSGDSSWEKYVAGVTQVFEEANVTLPAISGSTETNMQLVQSALAVTMIGKRQTFPIVEQLKWFIYGTPLVGYEVIERREEVASLRLIKEAIEKGIVQQIWPSGSKGIFAEIQQLTNSRHIQVSAEVDLHKSAGPATAVLLGIPKNQQDQAHQHFHMNLYEVLFND